METIYTMIAKFYAGMYDRDESHDEGATVVEYALIVALISIAAVGIYAALGGNILTAFTDANDAF